MTIPFIAENYKQRICIYKTIKELYGKRSEIVHGIKASRHQKKESVAGNFEGYMRISLKKYIEVFKTKNYGKHIDLIEEIDFG